MSTDIKGQDVSLEVYEDEVGGWAVRRRGEAQALSHHDTREQADRAAELHSSEGVGVDIRQDIFTNDPEEAVRARHTFVAWGIALLAAFALLAIISLIVVL